MLWRSSCLRQPRWAIPEYQHGQEVCLPKRKTAADEDFQLAKNVDLNLATGHDFRLAIDTLAIARRLFPRLCSRCTVLRSIRRNTLSPSS
jgi:hypothetical protein